MDERPREIELKLVVAPGDVKAFRAGLIARLGRKGETRRLGSVYYDTPAGDLRAAGVSLRVRTTGADVVQTVKMARGRSVGFFDRDEWEVALQRPVPDLDAFARTPAARDLDLARLRLEPVFETRIDRTRWIVDIRGGSVEVVFDQGRVAAGRRTEPLAELELELKGGQPRDLFRLVHEFNEAGCLRPGVEVKSERGYRLAGGKPVKPVKAEPVPLSPGMTAAAAFQSIVHGCLRHFGLNETLVTEARSPEALHQARVALRRLRSALSLFGDMVEDAEAGPLREDLRAVSRDFGEARNLDVYLARCARPEKARQPDEPGLGAFLHEMEARRTAAYERVVERLRSTAFRRLMLRLVEWVEAGPWLLDRDPRRRSLRDRPVRLVAARMLRRRRRKVKRRGRRLAALTPEARHRVRIDAKKLRYASEFFSALAIGGRSARRHAAFVSALEALQRHLGDLNDIQTGHEIATSFATGGAEAAAVATSGVFAAAHASGRADAQVDDLLARAVTTHGELRRVKPFWSGWSE